MRRAEQAYYNELMRKLVSWGAVMALGVSAFVLGYIWSLPALLVAGVDCHKYTSATPVPEGYAAPYNVFSSTRELLVTVSCETNGATMTVGSGDTAMYVYKYGYEWRGGSWQRITFSGSNAVSGTDWLRGKGSATLAAANTAMHVVGYSCQWRASGSSGAWKCGCRDTNCTKSMWQLQAYETPKVGVPTSGSIFAQSTELAAVYASQKYGPAGTRIALYGTGFEASNTVWFSGTKVTAGPPQGSALWFTVPDVTPGVYKLTVENSKGREGAPVWFAVTRPNAQLPVVESVTPGAGKADQLVVIRGKNFTPTGNVVETSFQMIENVSSSDGVTIRVKVPSFPRDPEMLGKPENKNTGTVWPVGIKVINANGWSSTYGTYKMTL